MPNIRGRERVSTFVSDWLNPDLLPRGERRVAAHPTLSRDLVAYWRMEEASGTRVDATGRGNDLTDNNTVTQSTGVAGNCAFFTVANSEYLSIADNADLSTGDIDFTMCMWFRLTALSGSHQAIVEKGLAASTTQEYYIIVTGAGYQIYFAISPNGNSSGLVTAVSTEVLTAGVWYFLMCYHDAANNVVGCSINAGVPDTAATAGAAPVDRAGAFTIGTYASGSYFGGKIDEFMFYKRLLTQAEGEFLYNSRRGVAYT